MKVQFASDLHLEFKENRNYLQKNPLSVSGDVLVLAGDIGLLGRDDDYLPFLSWCSDNYEWTFWIPGNHEFYNGEDITKYQDIEEEVKPNVFLVNNKVMHYAGVNFILSTGISKISPEKTLIVQKYLNDFKYINYSKEKFTVNHMTSNYEKLYSRV